MPKRFATAEQIEEIIDEYLPTISTAFKHKFKVIICEGKICHTDRSLPGTPIVIGVEYVNFMWHEKWLRSLRLTIRNILVHEAMHVIGKEHDKEGWSYGFYSDPEKDTYTPFVEKQIFEEEQGAMSKVITI